MAPRGGPRVINYRPPCPPCTCVLKDSLARPACLRGAATRVRMLAQLRCHAVPERAAGLQRALFYQIRLFFLFRPSGPALPSDLLQVGWLQRQNVAKCNKMFVKNSALQYVKCLSNALRPTWPRVRMPAEERLGHQLRLTASRLLQLVKLAKPWPLEGIRGGGRGMQAVVAGAGIAASSGGRGPFREKLPLSLGPSQTSTYSDTRHRPSPPSAAQQHSLRTPGCAECSAPRPVPDNNPGWGPSLTGP